MNIRSTSTLDRPSSSASDVEQALRSVMQCLVDSEEGFQKLGEEVRDPGLRRFCLEESSMRAQFLSEFEAVLMQEGIEETCESGTVPDAMHRAWGGLKSALGGTDRTLLATAEQGEEETRNAYRRALESDLPFPLHQLFAAHAAHVEASHNWVRDALHHVS